MFADDTNVFSAHQYIRYLFQIINQVLENFNLGFISNKLYKILLNFSINSVKKKIFSFFFQNR